jgi:hypothetical protein
MGEQGGNLPGGVNLAPRGHYQDIEYAPQFIVRNKKRTKNLTVTTGAQFITVLYVFGNQRGVAWSDPKVKAEMAAYEKEQERRAA